MKKFVKLIISSVMLVALFIATGCGLDDKNIALKPVEWTRSAKILGLKLSSDNFGVLVTNSGDSTVQVVFKADCYDKSDFWLETIENNTIPALGAKQSVYVPINPAKKETEKVKYTLVKHEKSQQNVVIPGVNEDNKSGAIYEVNYDKERAAIINNTANNLSCNLQVVYYGDDGDIIYARNLFSATAPANQKVAVKFDMGRTPKNFAKMDVIAFATYKK